ncbi:hypothetical protein AB5N19_03584 [Seiridium cardinale]|uniref:Uncharacterized protein n=1 Tax=Seiridium cardinale TaxID=138064 RepID=A0ABR2Y2H9_9PEZI
MSANGDSRVQTHAKRAYSFSQRQVDRVVSPQSRQKSYDWTTQFATERPLLFAFVVSQIIFSALPLGIFISFSLSTAAFAIISAIVFAFFWIGVALLVLTPVLFVTFSIAVLVWLWAVATFLVGRWVYGKLPVSMQGDMQVQMPNGKQVIFQKERKSAAGMEFENVDIKDEAMEIKK